MAAKKKKKDGTEEKVTHTFIIEFDAGEGIEPKAVTNLTVQPSPHETIISFYMAHAPLLLGTPEQKAALGVQGVKAMCVSKVIIPTSRLHEFCEAFRTASENVKKAEIEMQTANGQLP